MYPLRAPLSLDVLPSFKDKIKRARNNTKAILRPLNTLPGRIPIPEPNIPPTYQERRNDSQLDKRQFLPDAIHFSETEGCVCAPVGDQMGLRGPAFGDEGVGLWEGGWYYKLRQVRGGRRRPED